MKARDRFRGCLLGLACGDALATAVGGRPRGTFAPVTGMTGGGRFDLPPGAWTDDTAMALCLATSLTERGFDLRDQLERYCRWAEEGYLSSTGTPLGIGGTTAAALARFRRTGEALCGSTDPLPAANGCITRLAPVPMYFHRDGLQAVRRSGESARTTHGARECVDACLLFGAMLHKALEGRARDDILLGRHFPAGVEVELSGSLAAIGRGEYRDQAETAIRGSGYVVKSLEAALWCFYRSSCYEDAVLEAANLGDDAESTAAVCGQLAGAHYGVGSIPRSWRDLVARQDVIEELADRLAAGGSAVDVTARR